MTENHSERAHALLSASGASRWMNCTPSARLGEQFEDKGSSIFAEEGTLAHEFGELALLKYQRKVTPTQHKKRLAELRAHERYTDEMEEQVEKYTDYCLREYKAAKRKTKGAIMEVESKINLTDYIEDGFGTNDDMIIADGRLEVIDLKYGKGIRVYADDNPQLKLYGLGALAANDLLYDIHTVRLTIIQPRLDHISTWDISVEDLRDWGENQVKSKAVEAYAGEGEPCAGDWCRWCPVKPRCAALRDQNLSLAKDEFRDPKLLNDAELLEVYNKMDQVADWVKSVGAYMLSEALGGHKFEGLKVVEGRSNRAWKDKDKVKEFLAVNGYPETDYLKMTLEGIGAIEKLVGKKDFPEIMGDLVHKPPGKPTLAKAGDKRPEMNLGAEADFK